MFVFIQTLNRARGLFQSWRYLKGEITFPLRLRKSLNQHQKRKVVTLNNICSGNAFVFDSALSIWKELSWLTLRNYIWFQQWLQTDEIKWIRAGKLENNFARVVIARKEKEIKRIPSKFYSPEKKHHLLLKSLRNWYKIFMWRSILKK